MEKFFEDLKKFKTSLSDVGLSPDVENEVLKTYAVEKTKALVKTEDNQEMLDSLGNFADKLAEL